MKYRLKSQVKSFLYNTMYKNRNQLKRLIYIHHPVRIQLAGFKMYVQLHDWSIGIRIALRKIYEPHVTRAMKQFLQPGMVMLDIGANIGYFTLLAATQVGATGKVIAFEPNETNCELIRMNVEVNHLEHVVIHPYAIADCEAKAKFRFNDSNGILEFDEEIHTDYEVKIVRLDTFLPEEPRIDLIKMDIEGAEAKALQGMQQILHQHRPVIFTEFHPPALKRVSGTDAEAYLDQLRAMNYAISIIYRDQSFNDTFLTNEQIMNYLSVQKSPNYLDLIAHPL